MPCVASLEKEAEQAHLEGYLAGYSVAEEDHAVIPPQDSPVWVSPKPTDPVKWEDPDLQVVCWRAPEGISCLPATGLKAKPRWK